MAHDQSSQVARLLKAFKKQGKLTNRQMVTQLNIFRYSARIADLRSEGHVIVCNRVKDGLFEYIYQGLNQEAQLEEDLSKLKKSDKGLLGKIRSWL